MPAKSRLRTYALTLAAGLCAWLTAIAATTSLPQPGPPPAAAAALIPPPRPPAAQPPDPPAPATRGPSAVNTTDPPARANAGGWSRPRAIGACAAGGPQVAFPSDSPTTATGPGAIVWASGGANCGPTSTSLAGGRWGFTVAAVGPTDRAKVTVTQARGTGTQAPGPGLPTGPEAVGRNRRA